MLYDVGLNRGIRKKSLPEPNPQKIELPKDSDYHTVVEKAKDLYFSERIPEDEDDDEGSTVTYLLCDSSGIVIPVNETTWTLGSFYSKNSLQPSRHKLYVAMVLIMYCIILCLSCFIQREQPNESTSDKTLSPAMVNVICIVIVFYHVSSCFITFHPV